MGVLRRTKKNKKKQSKILPEKCVVATSGSFGHGSLHYWIAVSGDRLRDLQCDKYLVPRVGHGRLLSSTDIALIL